MTDCYRLATHTYLIEFTRQTHDELAVRLLKGHHSLFPDWGVEETKKKPRPVVHEIYTEAVFPSSA